MFVSPLIVRRDKFERGMSFVDDMVPFDDEIIQCDYEIVPFEKEMLAFALPPITDHLSGSR